MSRTRKSKILPPALPPAHVRRAEDLLAEALERRLTTVVAGPGFGKSTLVAAWAARTPTAWYTLDHADTASSRLTAGLVDALDLRLPGLRRELAGPGETVGAEAGRWLDEGVALRLCEVLEEQLAEDLLLVLDDVQELRRGSPGAKVLESVLRQAPAKLHLVLSSRREPPFPIERLRGRGQVLAVGASDLAFSRDDVERLLRLSLGSESPELADRLQALTAGWPAAVRLAIETVRPLGPDERARTLDRLKRPGGTLYSYLAEEVLAREPPAVRDLVAAVAPLERFTAELCEFLGLRRPRQTLAGLAARGLFVEARGGREGWYSLHALVREVARERLTEAELRDTHRGTASWFESQGELEEALRSLTAIADAPAIARLLTTHGIALVEAGAADAVADAVTLLPADLRNVELELVMAEAYSIRGELGRALECCTRAAEIGAPDAAVARRVGANLVFQGRLSDAADVWTAAEVDDPRTRDDAQVLSGLAHLLCLRGDTEGARTRAIRALAAAAMTESPAVVPDAELVLGMAAHVDGDLVEAERHYRAAAELATGAGHVLATGSARFRIAKLRNEQGRHEEALEEAEAAMRLTALGSFAIHLAWGSCIRGDARFGLGRFDEALADYEAARELYERLSSAFAPWALNGIGNVHRERGDLARARAAYEHAVRLAEETAVLVDLVPALAGLARILARDDPEEAARLAQRAVALRSGDRDSAALLSAGWVALEAANPDKARTLAAEAASCARARGEQPALAEALELQALAGADPASERTTLEEAAALWRAVGNPVGEARVELALALFAPGPQPRARAEGAARRLRSLGVRTEAATGAAGALSALRWPEQPPIEIQTLGGFRVLREGRPVTADDWRKSRKAQDLLKILIARRGRPTTREFLMEALWPEQDPKPLANRLSVALATVRGVLDPERQFPPHHFIAADTIAVSLDLARVRVDVDRFLDLAEAGLALQRREQSEDAIDLLAAAEESYAGDFLEEDVYEDWAAPLREEARAEYVAVARSLAEAAFDADEHDRAARYLLRILERDPHDERAHLKLISTLIADGRHGEARRRYLVYGARMAEIGVEPDPFPVDPRPEPAFTPV